MFSVIEMGFYIMLSFLLLTAAAVAAAESQNNYTMIKSLSLIVYYAARA